MKGRSISPAGFGFSSPTDGFSTKRYFYLFKKCYKRRTEDSDRELRVDSVAGRLWDKSSDNELLTSTPGPRYLETHETWPYNRPPFSW